MVQVVAVYPDTTSFYPATVSQVLNFSYSLSLYELHITLFITKAPRRGAMGSEPSLTVQFHGDADEMGLTPHRTVPLKYVILSEQSISR